MQKILYFDAFSGLSGDMILSALFNMLELDKEWFSKELKRLSLDESQYKLIFRKTKLNSIEGLTFKLEEQKKQTKHRKLKDIENILKSSKLDKTIIDDAFNVFTILAKAEGKMHGKSVYDIHFHEVGALDSIIDIVGISIILNRIKADKIYCSPLPIGRGFVKCEHGLMPLPAPAASEILKAYPVYGVEEEGEYVTPTGAAIIKYYAKPITTIPPMHIKFIGYGMGSAKRKRPNMLRTLLGEIDTVNNKESNMLLVETNLDDINPELIPYIKDKLFELGANDVYTTPTIMKKGRCGIILSILCIEAICKNVIELIFKETTAIGVRKTRVEREELTRKVIKTTIPDIGEVEIKESFLHGKAIQVKPEFESLKKLAQKHNIPIKDLHTKALMAYKTKNQNT